MNILVVNWRCIKNPEAGGAEVHLHEIFSRLVKSGNKVTLVAHHFPGAARSEEIDGIKIIRIGNKFIFDRQFKKYYLKNLADSNFDLVVDDISKIPLNTPKYIKQPLVSIIHHLHGKTLYNELVFPAAYYIYKKEVRIPEVYGETPIFAVSPSTKNELIEKGYPAEKIGLLYNAIAQEYFADTFPKKTENPSLVYIGRLKKYKRLETIIDAMPMVIKKFPDVTLKIGGMGSHAEALENYIRSKNLSENVKMLGKVTEEEKVDYLRESWVFVTMAAKEGWGITVIEANAGYTTVIGSDVPGLRDSIKNGETGILSPYDKPAKLAENIITLINDKEKLKQLQLNAKEWANKFSWDNSVLDFKKQVVEFYPELKNKIT
jgi:glycosyltransferase involved in cell wall biosynthesis